MSEIENFEAKLEKMSMPGKEYIGDAVYVEFDGYHVWLTTGDGNNQRIALESPVMRGLERYLKTLRQAIKDNYGQEW